MPKSSVSKGGVTRSTKKAAVKIGERCQKFNNHFNTTIFDVKTKTTQKTINAKELTSILLFNSGSGILRPYVNICLKERKKENTLVKKYMKLSETCCMYTTQ